MTYSDDYTPGDERVAAERAEMREYAMRAEVAYLRAEKERLRGLLTVARDGLFFAANSLDNAGWHVPYETARDHLRRSDPDATPGDESATDGDTA
jgi:hypothetical protein